MFWRYDRWGSCRDCDDPEARLYRPAPDKEGVKVVQFHPVCKKCALREDVHFTIYTSETTPPIQDHKCFMVLYAKDSESVKCMECGKVEYRNKF